MTSCKLVDGLGNICCPASSSSSTPSRLCCSLTHPPLRSRQTSLKPFSVELPTVVPSSEGGVWSVTRFLVFLLAPPGRFPLGYCRKPKISKYHPLFAFFNCTVGDVQSQTNKYSPSPRTDFGYAKTKKRRLRLVLACSDSSLRKNLQEQKCTGM